MTASPPSIVRRRRPIRPSDPASSKSISGLCLTLTTTNLLIRSLTLAVLGVLVLFSEEAKASASGSPVLVGVRSALLGSSSPPFLRRILRRTGGGRLSDRAPSRQEDPYREIWSVSGSADASCDEHDINEVRPALFRPASAFDRERLRSAEHAFRQKNGGSTRRRPASELDLLESLALPCSVVRSTTAQKQRGAAASSSANTSRGGASAVAAAAATTTFLRPMLFWENMVAGAISRSIAQTVMHPANTLKTILQNARAPVTMTEFLSPSGFQRLSVGAGANFILSVPHGAINFAVLEFVRNKLSLFVESTPVLSERADKIGPGLDFLSSAISTITCSIVSTPQMMITDNIMAGNYPNMFSAIKGLAQTRGIAGFYAGWWPGLVGKIPSYALTWTFFQQMKRVRDTWTGRPATDFENTVMGCVASGTTVCIMIPMDTIKTRLVTQAGLAASDRAYKGIIDCAVRIAKEEGIRTFYRGLSPRLVSVVPMIGIQFGVYEFIKKAMVGQKVNVLTAKEKSDTDGYGFAEVLQEAAMEVAASPEHPYPAPHFLRRLQNKKNGKNKKKAQATKKKAQATKKN